VVRRVPGGVGDLERPELLAAVQHSHVLLRDGKHRSPQAIHVLTVEPRRAREEPRRIDQVRRAALVHPHLELGEALDERAGSAGVVEVNVCEREDARALLTERVEQRLDRRAGPAVDQDVADLEDGDHARVAAVVDVDRPDHGLHLTSDCLRYIVMLFR